MTDFQSNVGEISEAELDKLFEGNTTITIDTKDVALATDLKTEDKNPLVTKTNSADIPFVDIEKLDAEPTAEAEVEEEEAEVKAVPEKVKATKAKDIQPEVNEVLKNTATYLIEKGLWQDFEGREDYLKDLTDEGYAELAAKQQEFIVNQQVEEAINSTGDYGKAIIEYAKNGGDPDKVVDLFKEQKAVESIGIDSEDGQKAVIEKYYTEVFDWTKDKAKKYINNLITSDELETEAKEVQDKYTQYYKEQLEEIQVQQAQVVKQQQEEQKRFVQTINTKLTERKDFTESDRKLIQNAVFKYDKALPDGTKVNNFYLKFAEMQKNPDDYLDLVKFVMDKQGYNKKVKNVAETESTEKKWSFLKGNAAAASPSTGSKHEEPRETSKKSLDLDFGNILRKK